jgi:hypothetical protein
MRRLQVTAKLINLGTHGHAIYLPAWIYAQYGLQPGHPYTLRLAQSGRALEILFPPPNKKANTPDM